MRAIIRVILPDTTKAEAIEISDKIEEIVKDVEEATVEITIAGR